jgi:hypothetical protein
MWQNTVFSILLLKLDQLCLDTRDNAKSKDDVPKVENTGMLGGSESVSAKRRRYIIRTSAVAVTLQKQGDVHACIKYKPLHDLMIKLIILAD